jgi:hypothetical protein
VNVYIPDTGAVYVPDAASKLPPLSYTSVNPLILISKVVGSAVADISLAL